MQLRSSRTTPTSIDDVWSVLSAFGDVADWATPLKASRIVEGEEGTPGAIRRCDLARPFMGTTHLHERLLVHEPPRRLAYEVQGGMGPFRAIRNEWTLTPNLDGTTRVSIHLTATPRNRFIGLFLVPLAKRSFRKTAEQGLEEFTRHVASIDDTS